MKSLAAIFVEQKKALVLEEVEIPKLTFGQVLVKVICSGICGSQLGEIDGVKGEDRYLPHLLGHEGTGEVLECGEGVTTVKDGDRVVLHWRKGLGIESPTPKYHSAKFGKINGGWITTFNQYAVISENRLTVIPSDFDPEVGALMGCAVTTGLGVINNNAKVKIGESVIVWGAGGIGLNIVQGAALVSAYPIIAIDLFDNKLDLAKKMGATHTINGKTANIEEEILAIVGKSGADIAIDNTGNPEIISRAYRITSPRGRTILVGVPAKGEKTQIYTLPLHFEKVLKGSHGGESNPHIDIPRYVTLYSKGILKLDPLITHRYKLEQINEAIAKMRTGEITGRCVVAMSDAYGPLHYDH
jgi:S-(hydroxymethyl)glutathione dehydrogenase/alcohol dehydrogenase